jgi:general secretion pathway protein A
VSVTASSASGEAPPQYEDFYGFVQSPFTLAPDPRFLFLSESHATALQLLLQSIARNEGVIVLTGDVGTGKTTICRSVIERLDTKAFTSLLLNPFLSVEELLLEILIDLGVVSRDAVRNGRIGSATKEDLVNTLREFLMSLAPIGGSGVLIIDEAQHLSPQVLDELRGLSNLRSHESQLLQIVLVGQTNLLDILASPEVNAIEQRISTRIALAHMRRPEIEAYIGHRLSVAHGSASVSFDSGALDVIHAASHGVPRVVNLLCDRSLMLGAGFGLRAITADVASEAASALGLRTPRTPARSWKEQLWRWAAVAAVVIALLAALLLLAPLSSPF